MANKKRSKKIVIKGNINPQNQKLLDKYIRHMSIKELSQSTIDNYVYELESWMRYLNSEQFDLLVEEVGEDDIEEYIYFRKKNGNNVNKIKFVMSSISAFYNFLRKKKIVKEHPMESLERPKIKGEVVVEQTYLTKEQVTDLKNKLKEKESLQLEVYINLSLTTMARVNAISNIKWENVDWNNNMITDVVEKEGYIVDLFVDDYTMELLRELRRERRRKDIRNPYVFITRYNNKWNKVSNTTLNTWCKQAGELIDVLTLHPHDLRHTYATILKNEGMNIEDISKILHHQSVDTTIKFYIKQDSSKLKEQLKNFNPFDKK